MDAPGRNGNSITYRVVAIAVIGLVVALAGVLVQQVLAVQVAQTVEISSLVITQAARSERIAVLEADRGALSARLDEVNRRLGLIEMKVDRLGEPRSPR